MLGYTFFNDRQPTVFQGLLSMHTTRSLLTDFKDYDSSGQVINPTYSPIRDNTQHFQQRDINTPRNSNPQTQQNIDTRPTP